MALLQSMVARGKILFIIVIGLSVIILTALLTKKILFPDEPPSVSLHLVTKSVKALNEIKTEIIMTDDKMLDHYEREIDDLGKIGTFSLTDKKNPPRFLKETIDFGQLTAKDLEKLETQRKFYIRVNVYDSTNQMATDRLFIDLDQLMK